MSSVSRSLPQIFSVQEVVVVRFAALLGAEEVPLTLLH